MNNINTGGPAFPLATSCGTNTPVNGMTLRDYFAAKAMQSILLDPRNESDSYEMDASFAYDVADAMLKAREA